MNLSEVYSELASPFPSERTHRAAEDFLALADAGPIFERTFPFLTWQRSLLATLSHLEAAGADLSRLTIEPRTLAVTFAGSLQPMWGVDGEGPIPAAALLAMLRRHKRLLGDGIAHVLDAGADRFSLLSGRAFEVRFPTYTTRMEFDTDVVAADIVGAVDVVACLAGAGYEFVNLHIRGLEPPDADCKARREVGPHLVTIGVVVGPYFGYERSLYAGSETLGFRGRTVAAVRPEDMLVTGAARVRHKGVFTLSSFSDAAVILDGDAGSLDWTAVGVAARQHRLVHHVRVILRRAEAVLGRPAVPEGGWRQLGGAGSTGLDRLGERIAARDTDPDEHAWSVRRRRDAREWRWRTRPPRRNRVGIVPSQAVQRVQRSMLYRQQRRGSSGTLGDALLTRLRTRTGTLCELAEHLAAPSGCVGTGSSWRGPEQTIEALSEIARRIPSQFTAHDCMRWRFDLATRYG